MFFFAGCSNWLVSAGIFVFFFYLRKSLFCSVIKIFFVLSQQISILSRKRVKNEHNIIEFSQLYVGIIYLVRKNPNSNWAALDKFSAA